MPTPHPAAVGGSPLYTISAEHVAGLAALAVAVICAWLFARDRIARLAPIDELLFALVGGSAAIHLGLAIGHVDAGAGVRALFLADAIALAIVARRILDGARAGRLGLVVLTGSVLAYWLSALGGSAPDQLGVATKLGEILALGIIGRPAVGRRAPIGSAAIVLLVVATATASWIGAFRASAKEPGAVAGHHVHGDVAPPGTVLPAAIAREATREERIAADGLLLATRAAIAQYADPAVAAAAGYRVAGMHGIDFHANNPAYEKDGRTLDPARPETLVYAVAPDGEPVLLGALFVMSDLGARGPAVGGPLTMWHAHQDICASLVPLALSGVLSPLGTCPIGSVLVPITPEMMHIWTVPGAPHPFGDLDDEWKRAYLAALR